MHFVVRKLPFSLHGCLQIYSPCRSEGLVSLITKPEHAFHLYLLGSDKDLSPWWGAGWFNFLTWVQYSLFPFLSGKRFYFPDKNAIRSQEYQLFEWHKLFIPAAACHPECGGDLSPLHRFQGSWVPCLLGVSNSPYLSVTGLVSAAGVSGGFFSHT